MKEKYRAVFNTDMGLDVLADILQSCHFGCTLDPDNTVQVSEYNVGIMILAKCGVFEKENSQAVTRALFSIPTKEES